jgi:hypothetical protein
MVQERMLTPLSSTAWFNEGKYTIKSPGVSALYRPVVRPGSGAVLITK